MSLERNKNLDIVRAIATLLVVIYHSWVLAGQADFRMPFVRVVIPLGGELGVTSFFLLSGYGIYCSIYNTEGKESVKFLAFMQKRCRRILPAYWFNLVIMLFIGSGAVYLSVSNWANILTHILFIHNLFPGFAGAINGVLWTIGVTVQFYIIAIPLYKGVKKFGYFFLFGCIMITILSKVIVFSIVLPAAGAQNYLEFFAGRQLITALDNFVVGMMVAEIIVNRRDKVSSAIAKWMLGVSIIVLVVVCKMGIKFGIHMNNISGYIWHSMLAVVIGIALFAVSYISMNINSILYRILIWISKCEYSIYLWHLVIMRNLIERAPLVGNLIDKGWFEIVYIIFTLISVIIGYLMTKVENSLKLEKIV